MPSATWAAADDRPFATQHPTVSCPAFDAADGTVLHGIVRDKRRGRAVPRTTIAVTDSRRGARTTSDAAGAFLITDVPRRDTLYVAAIADGYEEWFGKVAVTRASPFIVLDLIPTPPRRVEGPFIVPVPQPGARTGVSECDEVIAKYLVCLDKMPADHRAQMKEAFLARTAEWKPKSDDAEAKATMAQGCKREGEAMKSATTGLGASGSCGRLTKLAVSASRDRSFSATRTASPASSSSAKYRTLVKRRSREELPHVRRHDPSGRFLRHLLKDVACVHPDFVIFTPSRQR